jgi:hypothetical protein
MPVSSSAEPPRTPWGDPDLQGNFANKDETAPFERAEPRLRASARLSVAPPNVTRSLLR